MSNITHVLIVTHVVGFSIRMRTALEKLREFKVATFSTAANAIDYLEQFPQSVALVDFTMPDMAGEDIVHALRRIQPDIGIVAAPNHPNVKKFKEELNLQAVVDLSSGVRRLAPILKAAASDTAPVPEPPSPGRRRRPAPPKSPEPAVTSTDTGSTLPLEFLISEEDDGRMVVQASQPYYPEDDEPQDEGDASQRIFNRLAAEEPPMPPFEEGGTVSDLFDRMRSGGQTGSAALSIPDQPPPDEHSPPDDDAGGSEFPPSFPDDVPGEVSRGGRQRKRDSDSIPALLILESANDTSTPLEGFSVVQFLSRIKRSDILPLPSWVQESERYIREPEFLQEIEEDDLLDQSSPTPTNQPVDYVENQEDVPTDRFEPIVRTHPLDETAEDEAAYPTPDELPLPPMDAPEETADAPAASDESQAEDTADQSASPAVDEAADSDEFELLMDDAEEDLPYDPEFEEFIGDAEADDERESTASSLRRAVPQMQPAPSTTPAAEARVYEDDDPVIARMALTLTQVSLEDATADATVLARDGQIVATAGRMLEEDIEDIRHEIAGDWDAAPGQARIRFITLPGSGKDYMLYSRRTENGYTLSMIFAGTMPLNMIRKQSGRLLRALASAPVPPESPPEAAVEPPPPPVEAEDAERHAADTGAAPEPQDITSEPISEAPEGDQPSDDAPPTPAPALKEHPGEEAADEPPAAQAYYHFVWLLRDASARLPERVSRAVAHELQRELVDAGWQIKRLDVQGDRVYLYAGVPDTTPSGALARDLMQRSARIAAEAGLPAGGGQALWADAYLVQESERELTEKQIERFVQFARG